MALHVDLLLRCPYLHARHPLLSSKTFAPLPPSLSPCHGRPLRTDGASAKVRVNGAPAEATLSTVPSTGGAELRWRRAGGRGARATAERSLSLEAGVLGVEAKGKQVVVKAFVADAARPPRSCSPATGGKGAGKRRRRDYVFGWPPARARPRHGARCCDSQWRSQEIAFGEAKVNTNYQCIVESLEGALAPASPPIPPPLAARLLGLVLYVFPWCLRRVDQPAEEIDRLRQPLRRQKMRKDLRDRNQAPV